VKTSMQQVDELLGVFLHYRENRELNSKERKSLCGDKTGELTRDIRKVTCEQCVRFYWIPRQTRYVY